jgi:NADPH:quinone reductase-like Zn-dependent oxidoreductase
MQDSMRAVVIHEQGSPDVLRFETVAVPSVGSTEALIKVRACALNHLDLWCRKSLPGVKLPMILGCDVAGQVVAVGSAVDALKTGAAVLVAPGTSCQSCPQCWSGQEQLCRRYKVIGEHLDGGYAEYVKVPAANCLPMPSGMNFHEAAAIPLVFITAWHMLVARAALQMGETLLVIGGGSGVGSAAIQIGKLLHCRVIATAGGEQKAALARKLGADEVIDHNAQKIADEIKGLTDKRGVDVIFEHVGPAVWSDCLLSLAIGGRLVTCGATTGPRVEIELPRLFMKNQSILGSMMGTRHELATMLPFFEKGLLKPVVSEVLPLVDVKKAHELLESRKQFGKIVLDVSAG